MRVLRRLATVVLILVLVLVLAVGALLTWITARSLPQVSGTLSLAGLHGTVTVTRDVNGMIDVYADDAHDLFLAQGYVHAQERIWQMELWRHIALGRLSELFGSSELSTDEFIRTLGWPEAAQADLDAMSPDTRAALDAYSAGVNDYLDSHRGNLGLGFVITGLRTGTGSLGGYQPEPWTALDSAAWAKVQAWSLGGDYTAEIFSQLVSERLGAAAVGTLIPPYRSGAPVIVPTSTSTGPSAVLTNPPAGTIAAARIGNVRPGAALASTQATSTSTAAWLDLAAIGSHVTALAGLDLGGPQVGDHGVGSNDWVVAPSKSADGHALLANDPHLGIGMPSVWIMNGLHCRTVSAACPYDVTGVSFPGDPGVVLGHNASIAWGATNTGPDVEDLFIEKVDPSDPTHYLFLGQSIPFTIRHEVIKVAGRKDPVVLDVRLTGHGPIVNDVEPLLEHAPGQPLLSLRWTATARPDGVLQSFLELDSASNFTQFRAALSHLGAPSQNFVYADVHGNIGYQMPGFIPVRAGSGNPGLLPVPGWDGQHEWIGEIPYDNLPSVYNPPSGIIVTANNAVVDSGYPYYVSSIWDPGYRAERITQMLTADVAKGGVTQADMAAIQTDTLVLPGDRIVPALADAAPATADGRTVLALIQSWDGRCGVSSTGCTAFSVLEYTLMRRLFDRHLGTALARAYVGSKPSVEAMIDLLGQPTSSWWDDPATPAVETSAQAIATALDQAGADLRSTLGAPSGWTWGRLHTGTFREGSLGSAGIGPLNWYFDAGPYPFPGTAEAVDNTYMDWSVAYPDPNDSSFTPAGLKGIFEVTTLPSYRLDIDMGNLDGAGIVQTTGQSGNPFDRHYGDLIGDYLAGRLEPLRFSQSLVVGHAVSTLTLIP